MFDLRVQIYGLGQEWKGGDMKNAAGGGQKINILRENLAKYKDDKTTIILFSDAYDVIFAETVDVLLEKFESFKPARIVFGAEDFCWPDSNLQVTKKNTIFLKFHAFIQYDYPFVESHEKRFLNSGGFIGYASDIYEMIMSKETIDDTEDDQLFYTKIFLNEQTRVG